ncbi:hypothetical protein ACFLZK_01430 [Patescibacteria group bacterium]
MYVPVIKKLTYKKEFLVERALPLEGKISVSAGDKVDPPARIGTCRVVYEMVKLGSKFKSVKQEADSNYYADGALVGSAGRKKFFAPFNGHLEETPEGFVFKDEDKDYWLLPGVWGEIVDVSENKSVLIKSQSVDVHVPIVCGEQFAGELIVFPNPSDLLVEQYFQNYIKSAAGKIVYVGNHLNLELVEKANNLNLKALLAGSVSKEAYDYAMENNISLGIFVGFGEINTPDTIYQFINTISNRYVFFVADKNTLQVPVPAENEFKQKGKPSKILKYIRKDMTVQVLNSENFGQTGVVDRATKSGIFVKLHANNQEVEVNPPNLLIIE